jgi:hypothetical protein
MDRRYKQMGSLAALVRERCHATPFVHASILSRAEENAAVRSPCCIACINWIRRLSGTSYGVRRGRHTTQKIPIPMDNLLLFLHCPGMAIVKPDQRSFNRMMRSLHWPVQRNPYMRFCTPIMEGILRRFFQLEQEESRLDSLVRIWWEMVGSPVILPDRVTARYVRHALRVPQNLPV